MVPGGEVVHGPEGGCMVPGGCSCSWGPPGGDTPSATAAGGTHPTGMHSCYKYSFIPCPSLVEQVIQDLQCCGPKQLLQCGATFHP